MDDVRPFYGFGGGDTELPQPSWFAEFAAESRPPDDSMLKLYRRAIGRLRRRTRLRGLAGRAPVPPRESWQCLINFGDEPLALPTGTVV